MFGMKTEVQFQNCINGFVLEKNQPKRIEKSLQASRGRGLVGV
jgi:hypothetical protein